MFLEIRFVIDNCDSNRQSASYLLCHSSPFNLTLVRYKVVMKIFYSKPFPTLYIVHLPEYVDLK